MRNKIMVIMCCGWLSAFTLGFADEPKDDGPQASMGERTDEKMTFDHNQDIYNDQANQDIRAKDLAKKNQQSNEQDTKKVKSEQDINKGQLIVRF